MLEAQQIREEIMYRKTWIWTTLILVLLVIATILLTNSGEISDEEIAESENDANTALSELSKQDQGEIPTSSEGLIDESGFVSDSNEVDIGDVIE
jgi:hypothetical protein